MVSYLEAFNMLSRKYAMFILKNHQKKSKAKVSEAYKHILSSYAMNEDVFNLWLEYYAENSVEDNTVMLTESYNAPSVDEIKEACSTWETSLKSLLGASRLHGVVVWRFVKPGNSKIGYVVWDVTDEPNFALPKIIVNVEGGDIPNSEGNCFEWLFTVLPECFLDCVDYPVGGAGKSVALGFDFNNLLNESLLYDSFWMKEKGTDSWSGLEMLLKLKTKIPDMTGSPVLNVRMDALVKKWADIVDVLRI